MKLKIPRAIWLVIFIPVLFVFLIAFQFLREEWLVRKWEAQIKQNQDPEELRTWAMKLFQSYATNGGHLYVQITNSPPQGIPTSKFGPQITLTSYDTTNGTMPSVRLLWMVTRAWGLCVGDTNFVGMGQEVWKPGIRFYREP
ncbi:MAG: hypothetical protein WCS42_11030 [Verrucomicrobiota bacterium]